MAPEVVRTARQMAEARREDARLTQMTTAEEVVALLHGTAEKWSQAETRPVLSRIAVYRLAQIDAMAAMAKKSRNAMVNMLLEVGLDSVQSLVDLEVAGGLVELEAEAMGKLQGEAGSDQEVY
jgi:tyrosyl-tRNA synthetase